MFVHGPGLGWSADEPIASDARDLMPDGDLGAVEVDLLPHHTEALADAYAGREQEHREVRQVRAASAFVCLQHAGSFPADPAALADRLRGRSPQTGARRRT